MITSSTNPEFTSTAKSTVAKLITSSTAKPAPKLITSSTNPEFTSTAKPALKLITSSTNPESASTAKSAKANKKAEEEATANKKVEEEVAKKRAEEKLLLNMILMFQNLLLLQNLPQN